MRGWETIRAELLRGRQVRDWLFMGLGLLVQAVVLYVHPEQPVAVVSAVAGIISVVLCSQRKISTFLFGFVQITTYLYLCYGERLWAEVGMNIFYFLSQIVGIVVWFRRYRTVGDEGNESVELSARRIRPLYFAAMLIAVLLLSWLVGYLLARYTNDSQPYLDAFTTVPAIFAQVLLVMAYREQWIVWLLVDVLSVVMWLRAGDTGNWCIAAQYAFWCLNCVYGYKKWSYVGDNHQS